MFNKPYYFSSTLIAQHIMINKNNLKVNLSKTETIKQKKLHIHILKGFKISHEN